MDFEMVPANRNRSVRTNREDALRGFLYVLRQLNQKLDGVALGGDAADRHQTRNRNVLGRNWLAPFRMFAQIHFPSAQVEHLANFPANLPSVHDQLFTRWAPNPGLER